jgi:RNA recognition motif-containing protein
LQVRELFVGQLTGNVTKEHLEEIFSCYGKVTRVDIAMVRRGAGAATSRPVADASPAGRVL